MGFCPRVCTHKIWKESVTNWNLSLPRNVSQQSEKKSHGNLNVKSKINQKKFLSLQHTKSYGSRGLLNIKVSSYQHRDPYVKDKTVSWPSYLEHGNPHTWERQSLYWEVAQVKSLVTSTVGNNPTVQDMSNRMKTILLGCAFQDINPFRAKLLRENINISLHFMSFLHTNKTQVAEIPPQLRRRPAYST